jgi:UDP-N-acetylmuramoyl-tripeptide--D-alanyl-D-alanine ligase
VKSEVQDARSVNEIMICAENRDMGILDVKDIITATGGRIIHGDSRSFTGVCIDSRKIEAGELFIALKGERFDGHDFLLQALKKGSGAVVHRPETAPVEGKTLIYVKDTLKALQNIAHFVRSGRDLPVVAVTGSNGKTTTKELISSVLSTTYKVLKNSGNLNNHIGLPLSLAGTSDDDQVIVLEMGASAPGEIRELCTIATPNYGVLTNISPAHLEGFGDIETVRRTKLELLDYVSVAVVNADDLFMMEGVLKAGFKGSLVKYGIKNPADIFAEDIKLHETGASLQLRIGGDRPIELSPKISGMFNIYNLLAAASVSYLFDIDPTDMKNAIDSFTGMPMRLEFKDLGGIKVISDVYNANPASTEEALKELARIRRGRAIAVLGDMLELGTYEKEAHRRLGRFMSELAVDIFIAVGQRMALAASDFSGKVYKLQTSEEAGKVLRDIWREGDTVLIKGSRGMKMERVLADGS